jgi:lipoprotein-releasing system ATP-binding protein
MISAKNIYHSYGELEVLKGIDLHINKGEFVSIVGESGAGKTTLLHILGTLELLQKGTLEINNTNINNLSEKKLAKLRNTEIGFVFQFHNLLEELSAIENICLPALIKGDSKKKVLEEAHELLRLVNLTHREKHTPSELSGGEQQRIAVARALINKPSIILADEPTGNLDSKNAEELHNLFLKLNLEIEQTFVIITHNEKLADQTNRKIKIKDGKII